MKLSILSDVGEQHGFRTGPGAVCVGKTKRGGSGHRSICADATDSWRKTWHLAKPSMSMGEEAD
jgi:hypothetical protein